MTKFKTNQALFYISKIVRPKLKLHGIMKRLSSIKFTTNIEMKKRGVVRDFLINFSGVFIMKHEQPLGSFSIYLSSYCNCGTVI